MTASRAFLASVGVALLAGCASGPGPDLHGSQGPSLMAAYSGTWVLLRLESDDMASKMREGQGGAPPGGAGGGMTGGRPGGGMTGGRPGGGMSGGRPGGGGMPGGMPGGIDPEAMRRAMATIQALAQTPDEISLTLGPGSVSLVHSDSVPLTLVLGAEETEVRQRALVFFAAAAWTKKGLEIERRTDTGAGVKDRISVHENGHLVVKREIELPQRGAVKGTLVYRKDPQPSRLTPHPTG